MCPDIIGNHCFLQEEDKTHMGVSIRQYALADVVSFAKTTARYGGLSNMAPQYPLFVNEVLIYSSESLYQACKFPLHPEIQKEIIEQRNPMVAKEISRKYEKFVRDDWDKVKYRVMEWCLEVKLIQNWDSMANLLIETGNKDIVEYSVKDEIWGAKRVGSTLVGQNAMGRLLMQVRANYIEQGRQRKKLLPPDVVGFLLFGYPIGIVYGQEYYNDEWF